MTHKHPTLIVLNGASSAGKTLTAQSLVKILGADCIVTGFDDMLARVQPFDVTGGVPLAGLRRAVKIARFQWADGRWQLFKTLHREVVALYQSGHNVIVETALMDKRALQDAAACFAACNAFFIGLKPPLAVSEQWEAMRGDRPRGHARKHYDLIHAHGMYDLVLDSSQLTPTECATAILQRLAVPPPDAFRRLLADSHG